MSAPAKIVRLATRPFDEFLTLAGVLRRPGWSRSVVAKVLGSPDALAPNPYYRSGAPLRLYLWRRVADAEGRDEFTDLAEAAECRREHALRGVETKRQRLLKYAATVTIELPALEPDDLTRRAVDHYNARLWARCERRQNWDEARPATVDADGAFLDRISVNYLRHRMSDYERELRRMAGKVGADEAKAALRRRVLESIAAAYPQLADEAERQKAARAHLQTVNGVSGRSYDP